MDTYIHTQFLWNKKKLHIQCQDAFDRGFISLQASQMGEIGITVSTFWMVPKYQTIASSKAASRALDFAFGW